MPNLGFLRSHSSGANAWVWVWATATALLGHSASAASANGWASATVTGDIVSQPVAIFLQPPLANQSAAPAPVTPRTSLASFQFPPIRLGYTIDKPSGGDPVNPGATGSGPGTSFGISLIDVDSAGMARFSVAGANATSGYVVQFATSPDSLLRLTPSAAGDCTGDAAANQAQGCDPKSSSAALIFPTRALAGGGRLAVEVSQALNKLLSGELSVQVNYN